MGVEGHHYKPTYGCIQQDSTKMNQLLKAVLLTYIAELYFIPDKFHLCFEKMCTNKCVVNLPITQGF